MIRPKGPTAFRPDEWLPRMDSNHDKQIQNLLCYHYTTGQENDPQLRIILRREPRFSP